MNHRTTGLLYTGWVVSLLLGLMAWTPGPVWADECEEAKKALAAAEVKLEKDLQTEQQAKSAYEQAQAAYEAAYKAFERAYAAFEAAFKAVEAARKNVSIVGLVLGTAAANAYKAAEEAFNKANADFQAADQAVDAALEAEIKAGQAFDKAMEEARQQEFRVENARRHVEEACKKKKPSELGKLIENFMGDAGQQTIRNYTGRAQNANTEDIAIEQNGGTSSPSTPAPAGGGGGGGATTNASFDASCDINTGSGTNTVSINGTPFCSATGAAPAINSGTANFTCVPGATVTISATCSATNCRVFANSVTNLSCPFTVPGFLSGGFGGSGGFSTSASISCTCQ